MPQSLNAQLTHLLAEQPQLHTLELAEQLNVPEGAVIRVLPKEWCTLIAADKAQTLLSALSHWGNLVTIVEKNGSIFEIKLPFPEGKSGYGYYNLDRESALQGHLKLEHIAHIALVSKPFHGKESYAIVFIAKNDEIIFKIYLGRDENRQILSAQLDKFNQLKQGII